MSNLSNFWRAFASHGFVSDSWVFLFTYTVKFATWSTHF